MSAPAAAASDDTTTTVAVVGGGLGTGAGGGGARRALARSATTGRFWCVAAGVVAAITAAQNGAKVVLFEKEAKISGNSAKATSGINLVGAWGAPGATRAARGGWGVCCGRWRPVPVPASSEITGRALV